MSKVLVGLAALSLVTGGFVIAACVGDDPAGTTTTLPDASTTDAPATSTTTTPTGTSTSTSPGSDAGGSDAGSSDAGFACSFQPLTFPCDPGQGLSGTVCWGPTRDCTVTQCDYLSWRCDSPRQCSNTACCVPAATANYVPRSSCNAGALAIASGATNGANCENNANCATGEIQLCQYRADCPNGQYCAPVAVGGQAPASFAGSVLGVCTPDP